MTFGQNNYGIVPPSGNFGENWPSNHNIPTGGSGSISTGGWTIDNLDQKNTGNEGFIQQSFLGASIRGFNVNAGFGDTTSSLNVELANDEFHRSDYSPSGVGDDPYHGGVYDTFSPPVVGTPVFFKFGKNPATVEQAYRQSYDNLYGIQTLPDKTVTKNAFGWPFPSQDFDPDNFSTLEPYHFVDLVEQKIEDRELLWKHDTPWRGRNHFTFGGILQSYTQNKSAQGVPLYSAVVSDPREILSSVEVLLNSYQGTTFNNKNIINLYGFLEYDPSVALLQDFAGASQGVGIVKKITLPNNTADFFGVRHYWDSSTGWEVQGVPTKAIVQTDESTWSSPGLQTVVTKPREVNLVDQYYFGKQAFNGTAKPEFFPITGQGFSRRSDKGMPWYRISQGLSAIFQYYGFLPQEYVDAGFGGQINFRGYNYVVDFSGIPTDKIPLLYYMDFDKINLLDLAQELCDIISHDLFVTLLPVIDHPASEFLHKYNEFTANAGRPEDMVVGIIRLDAIDRTQQPQYGAIKSYLDNLESRGIEVENQDVGYELSNVTTDKFVVGGQEVDMYLFHTERDRDELWKREGNTANLAELQQQQWQLPIQEQQQALPYYGMLGNNAVSIPRGFGPYQQILLDAIGLDAFGVGNYYVATELELRAALVSFESWKNFLLSYNDVYIEDISEHSAFFDALSSENDQVNRVLDDFKTKVNFDSLDSGESKDTINNYLNDMKNRRFAVTVPRSVWASDRPYMSDDGYPASPCSPPLGYPLYYKRATRIGIVEAGVGSLVQNKTRIVTDAEKLKKQFENSDAPNLNLSEKALQNRIADLEKRLSALGEGRKDDEYKKSNKYKNLVAEVNRAKKTYADMDQLMKQNSETKALIAFTEDLDKPENASLARFMFNIEKTAKKHTENAKKVYNFVKQIAEECLGKKFLVRIPKACNLNYNVNITTFNGDVYNIKSGPFGFAPRPINADPNYASSPAFASVIAGLANEVTDSDVVQNYLADYQTPLWPDQRLAIADRYTNGALKGNFNPFSEQWEWNYKPEPQGGFFANSLFGTSVSPLEYLNGNIPYTALPLAMQQGLVPIDVKNLLSDSSRLKCYAKYNNSQVYDFTGVNASEMTQQTITNGGQFVPDLIDELPNNNINAETTFNSIENIKKDQNLKERKANSVAFVKCNIEEKLFLPPKLETANRDVWANEYEFRFAVPPIKLIEETIGCTKTYRQAIPRAFPIFSVPEDGGSNGQSVPWTDFRRSYDKNLDGFIIDTKLENLDDEHVYALVTVPGRIKCTADLRWKDGPMQAYNTVKQKHLMTMDVVKIPEFSQPNLPNADLAFTKLPCGPVPIFDNQEEANRVAEEYSLTGSHYRPDAIDWGKSLLSVSLTPDVEPGWRPGPKGEEWIKLSLEQISTARRVTKQVLKGFALNAPQIELGFTSPSPIFPDMFAIPLMSQERCYGPWMSSTQLDPTADARVKYSNIGGRVEFVKDENLAPWNYAGYQLMDQAGATQANFSNSLLLFSERGGFVMPDAPTGISLATALQDGGPLITSISINVGEQGVKTTVKMDLYTSSFGKLQKQKEDAISQMGREKQKLADERNSAIRRGLGKKTTSTDLVNTVMEGGGREMQRIASEIASQVTTNQMLGKEIDEQMIVVGKDGGTSMSSSDLKRVMDTLDQNTLAGQFAKNVVTSANSMWQVLSTLPSDELPSMEPDQQAALEDRLNNSNQGE